MLLYVEGNIFQSPAQTLVNTVNTVGVMGKGIAYDFKSLYPDMFREYRALCERKELKIGTLWLWKSSNKWVLNFPTKKHWRNPSKVEYVEQGLQKFVDTYDDLGIHSIAFPPLGCGNGQLDFDSQVQPLMDEYLSELPIDVFIYPGKHFEVGTPEHEEPEEMWEWLRSEPQSLPFAEVWSDLKRILETKSKFETVKGRSLDATISDRKPNTLVIASGGRSTSIEKDELIAFWDQIRTYGFSMSNSAPVPYRTIFYLLPIFAELPYVKFVRVSDNYESMNRAPATGLQVLPIGFRKRRPQQMALFEMTEAA